MSKLLLLILLHSASSAAAAAAAASPSSNRFPSVFMGSAAASWVLPSISSHLSRRTIQLAVKRGGFLQIQRTLGRGALPCLPQPAFPPSLSSTTRTRMKTKSRALVTSSSSMDPPEDRRLIKFCSQCGTPTVSIIPQGDDVPRDVCSRHSCSMVHYSNPKVVVGAVCLWEDKVLLCQRAIQPCVGKWGFPQGFMELNESTREGAEREVREEAGAAAVTGPLLAIYNIPNQVQLIYLATLSLPEFSKGKESLDVQLFPWDEIPYADLAFPTVSWALDYAMQVKGGTNFPPQLRTKIIGGSGPSSGTYVDG